MTLQLLVWSRFLQPLGKNEQNQTLNKTNTCQKTMIMM